MANRYFNQFQWSLEKNPVHLYATINFGASGAPTLVTSSGSPALPASRGVKSVVRNSAGDYTITLQDSYIAPVLMVKHVFNQTTAPAAPGMWIKAQSVGTLAGGTIELVFNSAGTATDPANGDSVLLNIILKQSSAP